MEVVTFGEMMVVFQPQKMGTFTSAHQFVKNIGGAEGNVAVGLERLGISTGYMTKLGNDAFGKNILSFLRSEGIDTSKVMFDDTAPTGIYFKEKRYPDTTNVFYYRSNSAASKMTAAELDDEYIKQANYLHITGITPFLSPSCEEMVFETVKLAKENNLIVSFDPNIRFKLMKDEEKGKEILRKLTSIADIVLPGVSEGQFITGEESVEGIANSMLSMGAKIVVIKLGEDGAYYRTIDEEKYVSGIEVKHIIDTVGAGDGFAAGLLAGLVKKYSIEDAVRLGNAVGAMNIQTEGDLEGLPTMDEVKQFLNSETDTVR